MTFPMTKCTNSKIAKLTILELAARLERASPRYTLLWRKTTDIVGAGALPLCYASEVSIFTAKIVSIVAIIASKT